ncbi:MAG: hypothetical protein GY719_39660 [bacterium]|nr:hypothetical protein [bacterium]
MKLELADPLIEKAVRLAVTGPEVAVYHHEREELYGIEDPDEREQAFQALHRRWFLASRLEDPFLEALAEVPGVRDGVARWCVSEASRAPEEGAELYVSPDEALSDRERRVLVLRLRPETLVECSRLLWLLRRELLHVADMVDPAFAYQPRLPAAAVGPVYDDLLRTRYAVLWSTTVVGRIERRGQAPEGTRDTARSRFLRAFAMLGDKAEEIFERLFSGERPSHDELVKLAREPRETAGMTQGTGIRCPVCGSPTYLRETGASLEGEVVACLRAERPQWRPEQGLCPRCADLFRVRAGVFARAPLSA